eukprot:GHVL01040999.1.p1 GENE.GHVL01040999.1~~GHVL01040999.1.p1  ORF type:complete len:165 (+),score=24.90 GHVL01040999.1:28-522(+)
MSLQGKLCLITGASRGIGKAIAISYARLGAALILVGRDAQKMISVVDECKKAGSAKVDVMEYDLSKMSEVDDLCKKLLPQGVDVIVNNAGMAARPCSVSEGDFEGVEQMFMVDIYIYIYEYTFTYDMYTYIYVFKYFLLKCKNYIVESSCSCANCTTFITMHDL